jgi:hypothetical protein
VEMTSSSAAVGGILLGRVGFIIKEAVISVADDLDAHRRSRECEVHARAIYCRASE